MEDVDGKTLGRKTNAWRLKAKREMIEWFVTERWGCIQSGEVFGSKEDMKRLWPNSIRAVAFG